MFATRHSVLMKKSYDDRDANFLAGHPSVVNASRIFSSKDFASIAPGTYFIAVFQVSSRRMLMHTSPLHGSDYFRALSANRDQEAILFFFASSFSALASQSRNFRNHNTVPTGYLDITTTLGPDFTYDPSDNTFIGSASAKYDSVWATSHTRTTAEKIDAFRGAAPATPAAATPEVEEVEAKPTREVMALTDMNTFIELESVYVKRGDLELLSSMKAIADGNTASNILLIGPSGAGKTSIPEAFAKANGMRYIYMNCATVRDPEEWFGFREAQDGSTVFVPTAFSKAVMEGNAVIVMDEINRVEPWLHNTLYPLLDHRRSTNVHGTDITVGQGVIFVATANLGGRFTGTFLLDAALSNRFDAIMSVRYLPADVEARILHQRVGVELDTAKKIVAVVEKLRSIEQEREAGIDVSTRTSLRLANIYAHSRLPFVAIVEAAAIAAVDDAALRKQIIDEVNLVVSTLGL